MFENIHNFVFGKFRIEYFRICYIADYESI